MGWIPFQIDWISWKSKCVTWAPVPKMTDFWDRFSSNLNIKGNYLKLKHFIPGESLSKNQAKIKIGILKYQPEWAGKKRERKRKQSTWVSWLKDSQCQGCCRSWLHPASIRMKYRTVNDWNQSLNFIWLSEAPLESPSTPSPPRF